MKQCAVSSPIGQLLVTEVEGEITRLTWSDETASEESPLLRSARQQIDAYFAQERQLFDLPMKLGRTAFQARFLQALMDIPFGETRTYGDLAKELGVSPQAIGQACGANPIPILIPCHRVLAADGLGGFSGGGGVESKVALLRHEGAASLLI